ncbi:MAG: hypothetical protein NC432_06455 [Roseburia sp.]|nr:hypothetical protein [Roseburia sp.]MCM1096628.1 hypothetical protein [Ruminococcus flavefaciens]
MASFIALSIVIAVNVKRQAKRSKTTDEEFWSREFRANSVRRKSLDGLKYITIPLESFPTHLLNENPVVLECIDVLESLTSRKIVNLTGWTNTDLKLEYGAANINLLTEYDQNYTLMVRTLQKWAELLTEAGYRKEILPLLEFAIATGADLSRTYYLLAEYYASAGQYQEIDRLRQNAKNLRSVNRDIIVRHLQETYPDVF